MSEEDKPKHVARVGGAILPNGMQQIALGAIIEGDALVDFLALAKKYPGVQVSVRDEQGNLIPPVITGTDRAVQNFTQEWTMIQVRNMFGDGIGDSGIGGGGRGR